MRESCILPHLLFRKENESAASPLLVYGVQKIVRGVGKLKGWLTSTDHLYPPIVR